MSNVWVDAGTDQIDKIVYEIQKLSKVFTALRDSKLTRRAIVLLIHDMTKVGKRDIETLLDALPDLTGHFLKDEDV